MIAYDFSCGSRCLLLVEGWRNSCGRKYDGKGDAYAARDAK